jgi:lipopolysaccharide/colanic/teichoic acid biosynthesis glycosyltransferase
LVTWVDKLGQRFALAQAPAASPPLCLDTADLRVVIPAPAELAAEPGARMRVVIAPETAEGLTRPLLALCGGAVPVEVVPWLWANGEAAPPGPIYRRAKRALDVTLSLVLLILAAPLLAGLALIVRLESPGPAFYRQPRIGRHGRPFAMYKLRTMRSGADAQLHERVQPLVGGPPRRGPQFVYKLPDDPRITRVGRILRKTSLDELPQFLNVLRGEMSLVGPRPELPEVIVHYETWQLARLALPPGVTGWWQVNGRSNHPMHLSTEYDLTYLRRASFTFDLIILARTLGAVVRGTGAF